MLGRGCSQHWRAVPVARSAGPRTENGYVDPAISNHGGQAVVQPHHLRPLRVVSRCPQADGRGTLGSPQITDGTVPCQKTHVTGTAPGRGSSHNPLAGIALRSKGTQETSPGNGVAPFSSIQGNDGDRAMLVVHAQS
jgi:hypothetical protein